MNITTYWNEKIHKMDWADMALTKFAVFAFALMWAKFYPELLSLDWTWYLGIWALCAIRPLCKMYCNCENCGCCK